MLQLCNRDMQITVLIITNNANNKNFLTKRTVEGKKNYITAD